MMMPGRSYSTENGYRYGFNGKENDNEVKGEGNQQDYGLRIYDPRIGKFLSVDPLAKEYPWNSTYAFAENDVIRNVDLDGAEKMPYFDLPKHGRDTKLENRNGVNVYTFKQFGTQYEVGEYGTKLIDEGPYNIKYPRTVYIVKDVDVINNSDYYVGDGSVIRTKGTNWHFWKTSNDISNATRVQNEGASAIGIGFYGIAAAGAATPLVFNGAPIALNFLRPFAQTAWQIGKRELLTNQGKWLKLNFASGIGDFAWQTLANNGDFRKNNLVSTTGNLLLGPLPASFLGYTVSYNLHGEYNVKNPISTNGLIQISAGGAGNWMGGRLGTGLSSGSTALPFLKGGFLKFGAQTYGNMVGNSVQTATENLTKEEKKKP